MLIAYSIKRHMYTCLSARPMQARQHIQIVLLALQLREFWPCWQSKQVRSTARNAQLALLRLLKGQEKVGLSSRRKSSDGTDKVHPCLDRQPSFTCMLSAVRVIAYTGLCHTLSGSGSAGTHTEERRSALIPAFPHRLYALPHEHRNVQVTTLPVGWTRAQHLPLCRCRSTTVGEHHSL